MKAVLTEAALADLAEIARRIGCDSVPVSRDRLDWRPARGRFRYLGRRLSHPRWYPAAEAACRG